MILTVSYCRSDYFIRNDLFDPTSLSDDRHSVTSSRMLMTSKEDQTHVTKRGPHTSIHCVRCYVLFLIHIATRIWHYLVSHSLQRTLASCQLITWLFCTAWSTTANFDCSLKDRLLDYQVAIIGEESWIKQVTVKRET